MKTKVVKNNGGKKFPALYIAHKDNTILLATSQRGGILEGTVLSTESIDTPVGEYSADWDSSSFEPFYGSVTLES